MANIVWGTLSAAGARVNDYTIIISETDSGHRITVSRVGHDNQHIDIPDADMADATQAANEAAALAEHAAEIAIMPGYFTLNIGDDGRLYYTRAALSSLEFDIVDHKNLEVSING